MAKKFDSAIVTTTIYVPKLLDSYADDALRFKHKVLFVVIGDKKTPPETAGYCENLAKRTGIPVEYFSIERQEEYLKKFPALAKHIPYNCIERRDIGLVYAYEQGCENIMTIDDDNLRVTEDYIGSHQVSGTRKCEVISSSTSWVNVCRELKEKHGRTFYHRGFPMEMRNLEEKWTRKKKVVRPAANAGLWLGDPDVDALERLYWTNEPTEATKYVGTGQIALDFKNWSPFNSQNTAVRRDTLPAYFLSPLVGRFSDIWGSYCFKYISDHLGEYVTFGVPMVKQERNPHNYWRDFDQERYGLALNMRFMEALQHVKLSAKDYKSCYAELTEQFPKAFGSIKLADDERAFLEKYFEGMRVWRDTFAAI
jgi:hypothetical protein